MTQDMTKDMILHTMTKKLVCNWRTRVLSAAHSSSLTGALTQRQDLCADEITARPSRDYGSCPTRLRLVVTMLLLFTLGSGSVWGQSPVEITSDTNGNNIIDDSEKKLYLIQSYLNTGFYMRPNGTNVTTLNSLTDEMKWFFLDAGTGTEGSDEVQYYYICDKDGKYMYFSSPNFVSTSNRIWITLQSSITPGSEDNYKFYIAKKNTKSWDAYNIIPKETTNSSSLNKQGGNAGTGNVQVGSGFDDAGSCWNLIALADYNWTLRPDCFTVSDTNNRYFYKIKSQNNASYFIKPGTNYVETSNENDDDMIWYFEEAASDALMTYYYIRHANTGQYLRYLSTSVGQENAIELVTHTGSETGDDEARFQFIVVRGANANESVTDPKGIIFNIIPKLLNIDTNINSVSCDIGQGKPLKTKADRNANTTHWSFESTDYTTDCHQPVISFSTVTGKVSISTETTRSSIYYTTDGTTPSSTNGTLYEEPFTLTEQTTIMAIVTRTGFTDSEVTTRTIYKVATPTIQDNGNNAVSITSGTEGATIYYTIDGSNPTTSSTPYSGPLSENVSGVTIKAIAVKDGMINSAIGSGSVTLSCATPVFTKSGNSLTISCPIPTGAIIYYTTNGDTPTSSSTQYTSPLTVVTGDVIKAIAVAAGYNNSEVATKKIFDDLTPTDGKYLINSQTDFETFVDMASTTEGAAYHYILKTNVDAGSPITVPFIGVFEVAADESGNFYTISGLTHPLFNTLDGGVVKNVILENVKIEQSGNVGAIAGEAKGYSRIYNCGILPSSNKYENEVSYVKSTTTSGENTGYCGGLVGWLKDDSRVINCFSYANITGGTTVAGIVGYNNFASTAKETDGKYIELKTAIVNCMFYGNITSGTTRYPVYGGEKILNNTATGINNYDFYRAEANLGLEGNNHYNCSWPAMEEYLTKYEYYRYLLNSNRELCGWWVGAPSAPSDMLIADVQAVAKDASLMAKWVLDPSIAPYPILKAPGFYPSAVNKFPRPDETNPQRIAPETKKWVSRALSSNTDMPNPKAAPETDGRSLGKITVKIKKNADDNSTTDREIIITAMDIDNNDFSYGKIQLPYYNSIFGNPAIQIDPTATDQEKANQWDSRYGGNYKDKVVVGWEITDVGGGTSGNFIKEDTEEVKAWESGFNFADRNCTDKDKERVFAQGGYYYVPYGVYEITITAKWADAIYLDNSANNSYDRVYMSGTNAGTDFAPAGHRPTTLGNGKAVQTGTISSKLPTNNDVYNKAIVLVGNHQYRTGNASIGGAAKGCTILSADFDLDDEPDYSLIWQLGNQTSRYDICPIRFDFLPVVEMGMAMKEDGSTQYYSLGCYRPLGHFEVTETSLIHFGQFEFGNQNRSLEAPLILNGGIYDQFTKGTGVGNAGNDDINYMIVGGNVYIPSFTPGAHVNSNANYSTRHCAVNVLGGRINNLYLTGNFNNNVTPNADNPHCYIDGGNFKQVAAAGKEGINGDVFFKINHSVIEEFYGGSTMDQSTGNNFKTVKGNINVTVDNSKITKYCGGPKFGNMNIDSNTPSNNKTVTTNATGTTFGVYYGGGNGGTSYVQYLSTDATVADVTSGSYSWTQTGDITKYGNIDSYTPGSYRSGTGNKNYMANYEMEIVNTSTGTDQKKAVFRTYFYAAQFSATDTGPITNNLTDCIVLTNFYGGGNLGGVKGNVTSTLLGNTRVEGSVFGAGFSASIPEVSINNKDKEYPTINVYTGIITPTPEGSGSKTTYTWTNDNTLSTGSPISGDGKYFYTEVPLVNLGSVAGNVNLTLEDNVIVEGKVFNKDGSVDATKTGGVYGGGDESEVIGASNKITVTLKDNVQINGNVFGGGNNGKVEGSTEVNIVEE